MAQVTYTVGLLDAHAKTVYSGSLVVQTQDSYGSSSALAALLSLDGLEPLVLAAVTGGGAGWSFYGSNTQLDVSTSVLNAAVRSSGSTPSYVAGSIALTASGQQQNLLILGFQGAAAPSGTLAAAPAADQSESATGGTENALTGIPPVDYNFTLQLLDTSFAATGTGTFTGSGAQVRVGVVGQAWVVTGTLTLDGGAPIAIQGRGVSDFWYGSGTASDGTPIAIAFGSPTFISGSADGTVTVGTQTSFFVGTSVTASTVAVDNIAAPAAEPA